MRMMDVDRLRTVRHYAEERGIVKETVLSRVRRGRLESVRIDGRIFIVEEEDMRHDEDQR